MDLGDLGPPSEGVESELTQLVRVAAADVHQEVLFTGHVVELQHFGQPGRVALEAIHQLAGVLPEPHRHQRLHPHAQRLRSQVGVDAPDHAALTQPPHPFETAGGGQPDLGGEVLIGDPSILRQKGEDAAIDSVEFCLRCHRQNILWHLLR